jgi:hypothetical protein
MENENKEIKKTKWYYKDYSILTAFIVVGPFALPLVWKNPRYSRNIKIIISALMLIATYFMVISSIEAVKKVMELYSEKL